MFRCLKKNQNAPRPSEHPPFFSIRADRPPKQVMLVARQEDLG